MDVWVGNVVDSRNAGYTPDFTDCVKHGDMSGRHRHDAFGVSFEYLSCKPFGNLFTVADDKQPCGYTVRSLPGIPDGYQYAFLPARPFDVEAGGIFGSIKQQVEIIEF